jgi:prepilin-type N-terminal cleavage/methylation domain-containing protein
MEIMINISSIDRASHSTASLSRYGSRKAAGFTIIEVLIVLAIAGLIMLVVFLAVPNLQRNQRNTSRRASAARIATAVSNFVANNNGTVPSTSANVTSIIGDAGTLSQYPGFAVAGTLATAAANSMSLVAAGAGTPAAISVDGMQLVTAGKCATAGAATNAGVPSARSMALQYAQEQSGGGFTGVCMDI